MKKNKLIFSLIQMKTKNKGKINSNIKITKTFITIGLDNNLNKKKIKSNQMERMNR